MSTGAPLLAARAVSVVRGGRSVLERVDFALHPGELVGLLGPNGAGKTTLLRALLGLQDLQAGCVELRGRHLEAYADRERAQLLAYLPQGGRCHWAMSVEQVVALGRLPFRAPWARLPADDTAALARAMREADVGELAQRPVTALSGGEQARVLLARALAVEAPILVVDEPTAGLDPVHQLAVMEVLRDRTRRGTGVVATLHDLSLAARFCDRLVLLGRGRVAAAGTVQEVLTPTRLRQVFGVETRIFDADDGPVVVAVRRSPP